ncbi:MAG: hypothetical protein ACK521_08250 [bacterium]
MFNFYATSRNVTKMLEVADELCLVFKAHFGESSDFYVDGLYL